MEEIRGTLSGVTVHNFDTVYDLVFTGERVIAVNIQHPLDTPPKYTWRTAFLGDGLDRHERNIERQRVARIRRETAKNASPAELLNLSGRNFEIPYARLTGVEVKRRFFEWRIIFTLRNDAKVLRHLAFYINKTQVPEARRLTSQISNQ